MNRQTLYPLTTLLLLSWALSGCITATPTPASVCRADLVSIGLGGTKRNFTQNTIRPGDIKAYITVGAGPRTEILVRALYRAYADYTSYYARDVLARDDYAFSGVEPYDGMWWVTVQLVDAATQTPIASGPGPEAAVIEIESTDGILQEPGFPPGTGTEGMYDDFNLTIQDCDRNPSQNELDQFFNYRRTPNLRVAPSDLTGITDIAGLQLVVTYTAAEAAGSTQSGGATVAPRLVPVAHDPNLTLVQWTDDSGPEHILHAYLTNPAGFLPDSTAGGGWQPGNSTFRDLDLALIVTDTDLISTWCNVYAIDEAASYYVDSNGDEVTTNALEPVLSLDPPLAVPCN